MHNACRLSRTYNLGYLRGRSPLLAESLVYFIFVLLLRCFSSQALLKDYGVLTPQGFPIQNPSDQGLLATPRGLSQLYTSFVGCQYQGIPHQLFVALPNIQVFIDDYVISFLFLITVYLALTKWLLTNQRFETSPSQCFVLQSLLLLKVFSDFTPANALIYAYILCNFQCTIRQERVTKTETSEFSFSNSFTTVQRER